MYVRFKLGTDKNEGESLAWQEVGYRLQLLASMTFLIANLLIIAVISRPVASNYDCLCYYGVEQAVYSKPDPASTPLGYVYEFDCKALDTAENHPEWWTIFFEHMVSIDRSIKLF